MDHQEYFRAGLIFDIRALLRYIAPASFEKYVLKEIYNAKIKLHRGVEQLVARRAHNPKVLGSSPSPATKMIAGSIPAIFVLNRADLQFTSLPFPLQNGHRAHHHINSV
jgi:hypothetical protein